MEGLFACVNGRIVPASQATVSSFDFGFLYGVGLFETLRTWKGHLFMLERHLVRLEQDCRALGWQLPFGRETLAQWLQETVQANAAFLANGQDLRLRLTVTPGLVDPTKGWWAVSAQHPTVVIHATPLPPDFDARHERGWTAVLAPWRRPLSFPLWQFKTTNYFANVLARQYALQQGADEALWCNTEERLVEGTATNLFVVYNGELWTPPPEEGLLPGIARSVVLEVAVALGLTVCERPVPLDLLPCLEEAFVTNAVIGVVSLTKVGDRLLPLRRIADAVRTAYLERATQGKS